jgi:hypothetical protein
MSSGLMRGGAVRSASLRMPACRAGGLHGRGAIGAFGSATPTRSSSSRSTVFEAGVEAVPAKVGSDA